MFLGDPTTFFDALGVIRQHFSMHLVFPTKIFDALGAVECIDFEEPANPLNTSPYPSILGNLIFVWEI
jgi:hypothetical protein